RLRSCLVYPSSFSCRATRPPALATLSLHDALPILSGSPEPRGASRRGLRRTARNDLLRRSIEGVGRRDGLLRPSRCRTDSGQGLDRKSTRLNSSHVSISYAVFCLKKKNDSTKAATA